MWGVAAKRRAHDAVLGGEKHAPHVCGVGRDVCLDLVLLLLGARLAATLPRGPRLARGLRRLMLAWFPTVDGKRDHTHID